MANDPRLPLGRPELPLAGMQNCDIGAGLGDRGVIGPVAVLEHSQRPPAGVRGCDFRCRLHDCPYSCARRDASAAGGLADGG